MLFNFAPVNKQRRPDVSFVSYQRWPKTEPVPETKAWEVVPNLAVEVVSRTETMFEVLEFGDASCPGRHLCEDPLT